MAKVYVKVGYADTVETAPGVLKEQITERDYYGELLRNSRRLQTASQVNDDINISNEISILSDPYAIQNFHSIRYVEFMGTKWKVPTGEVQYPRLILSLGGVYNVQEN